MVFFPSFLGLPDREMDKRSISEFLKERRCEDLVKPPTEFIGFSIEVYVDEIIRLDEYFEERRLKDLVKKT